MRGKIIVIEGTDCSGKETQTKALVKYLETKGRKVKRYSFPMYDTPTGKIVGGPFLGKPAICEGYFPEKAPNVDPLVSSLYYLADRVYNMPKIIKDLEEGYDVILDRYTYSNMAHQGGKISDREERFSKYEFLGNLEFNLFNLPIPDIRIFIHMPYEAATILKEGRVEEAADQNEADENHLRNAERAFLEVASKYDFKIIEGVKEGTSVITRDSIKSIETIANEIDLFVDENLDNKVKSF